MKILDCASHHIVNRCGTSHHIAPNQVGSDRAASPRRTVRAVAALAKRRVKPLGISQNLRDLPSHQFSKLK